LSRHSYGYCDRSGQEVPLSELFEQFENGVSTGLLVSREMLDIDHEQLQIGHVDANDDQTLDDPRPDKELAVSRALSAWNPVGGGLTVFGSRTVGMDINAAVGTVSVS